MPGEKMKLNADGEILVRGENIASRNCVENEATLPVADAVNNDGLFHTGDLDELDTQAKLYFKGSMKYVICTPERMKVYPADLEAALRRQPEIRNCVVVGAARGGNAEPCAALILRDRDENPELAVQRANSSLAGFQRIRHWFVWPDDD